MRASSASRKRSRPFLASEGELDDLLERGSDSVHPTSQRYSPHFVAMASLLISRWLLLGHMARSR